nr:MAG TPA: hypothetical protein [Caudoviricetes sp.]
MGGSALDFRLCRFGSIKNPLLCRSPAFHAGYVVSKVWDFLLYSRQYCRNSCLASQNVIFYFCFQCEALNS